MNIFSNLINLKNKQHNQNNFLVAIGRKARILLEHSQAKLQFLQPGRSTKENKIELKNRSLHSTPLENPEVSKLLFSSLDADDISVIEKQLNEEDTVLWKQTPVNSIDYKYLTLHFGVHYCVSNVLEKTGLSSAMPPEDVHSMARGSCAAGGSFYYADLVMEAMRRVGATLEPGSKVLDFGCSSGRIVRVLSAVYPEIKWYACDPNEMAVKWIHDNLVNINSFVSPQEPPLPHSSGTFSLVYAISIWSHFGKLAALKWFEEMRRIIRPGGYLLFTTHGYQSLAHYANTGLHSSDALDEIARKMYEEGFFFMNRFGEAGDWGVVHPEWGEAFISPDWWLKYLCPDWRVSLFLPGGVEGNQDLIMLEAR